MNRRQFLQATTLAALAPSFITESESPAQSEIHAGQLNRWLSIAEKLKPKLRENVKTPQTLVQPVPDTTQFLRWRMDEVTAAATLKEKLLRGGDAVVIDFGEHMTGHFAVTITGEGDEIDAPARIKLTFGECPAEIAEPFDPYKGWLSRSWLQDEVINIDVLPATIRLPRRYAFRYVKIEVIAVSSRYAVRFDNPQAIASTSAGQNENPLPANAPEILRRIDIVSLNTLRDCMQTVFEDGPKRDQRLWIGDARLQALANYDTFRNYDLAKRCLYLFAALPGKDGLIPGCVFEHPHPSRGNDYHIDYSALYVAMVLDYARAANDWATANDLWPVVRRQIQILSGCVRGDGIFSAPDNLSVFVDWKDGLDRTAAMHGTYIFALRQAQELARSANAPEEANYAECVKKATSAARLAFWDSPGQIFVSGPNRQVSWASQAWMVLAGVATLGEGATALQSVMKQPDAIRPGAPYLYHYFVEAMIRCGLKAEARILVESYWGGMVKNGADTFWEVYNPDQPALSPYGNPLVNSYCHGWSSTPAYLLRTGGLI